MKSHSCDFQPRALLQLVGLTLLPAAVFAVAMRAGIEIKLLPTPRPSLDAERAILIHKAEAAQTPQPAELLLAGDSSCMMNLSARQLSASLQIEVLNLGTFSYLDLKAHASLLREFIRANPGRPRAVVLMLHPETLRRTGSEPYYADVLTSFLAGEDRVPGSEFAAQVRHWLGVDAFQERLLARAMPLPLHGAFGRRHGFTHDLETSLARAGGSLVDPDVPQPLATRPEYRLAPTIEKASREFRATLPKEIQLFVGITPVAAKLSDTNHRDWRNASLAQWTRWLAPAFALTNLPAVLPDEHFTRSTHLRETAIPGYTDTVANSLRPLLAR